MLEKIDMNCLYPIESTDAYRQYRQLKVQHSHGETPSIKATKTEGSPTSTPKHELPSTVKKTQIKDGSDDVFGSFLNKPMNSNEKEPVKDETGDRKSTWKLRRWTKDHGYVTVSGGGGEEGESGDKTEKESSSTGKGCDQTIAAIDEVL